MFYFSITPIIICPFTLDLRQVKSPGSSCVSGNQSASLRFVGNAGGSLRFGPDQDEEEDVVHHLSQVELYSNPSAAEEENGNMTSRGGPPAEYVSVHP